MAVTIKMEGMPEAIRALNQLEGRVKFKHLRIALNAAMSPIKRQAVATTPEDTGLLRRSIRIKVKIPDASYNPAHHGRPAYGLVGPGRGLIGVRSVKKSGALGSISPRTAAAAEKLTKSGKGRVAAVRETQRFKGSPNFGQIIVRPKRASRYAHFIEKGRNGKGATHWLANAAQAAKGAAFAAFQAKIAAGINIEAAKLAERGKAAFFAHSP